MLDVYDSRDIGLLVVLVAKNSAVSLNAVSGERRDSSCIDVHDILWVPVHDGVPEIETFEIGDCGGLDLLGEAEVTT